MLFFALRRRMAYNDGLQTAKILGLALNQPAALVDVEYRWRHWCSTVQVSDLLFSISSNRGEYSAAVTHVSRPDVWADLCEAAAVNNARVFHSVNDVAYFIAEHLPKIRERCGGSLS